MNIQSRLSSPLRTAAATLVGTAGASFAHESHGTENLQWHAADFCGLMLAIAIIGFSLRSGRA